MEKREPGSTIPPLFVIKQILNFHPQWLKNSIENRASKMNKFSVLGGVVVFVSLSNGYVTTQPSKPTLCTNENQGDCPCETGDGWSTYTWWMEEGMNWQRTTTVQRCFHVYIPPSIDTTTTGPMPGLVESSCYAGYANYVSSLDWMDAER